MKLFPTKLKPISIVLVVGLAAVQAPACGPQFPNSFFIEGPGALYHAPVADFATELRRIHPEAFEFTAVPATNGYPEQSLQADLADLRAALSGPKYAPREKESIVKRHQAERVKLRPISGQRTDESAAEPAAGTEPTGEATAANAPMVIPELPGEFADYFRGLIDFHSGKTNEARHAWHKLLARPAGERHYRSTWAAYKLGQSFCDVDPERAIGYCREVRALAKAGFADSLGLAAASVGWEARANLRLRRYDVAISLYLDQLAAGDESAVQSLTTVASAALSDWESEDAFHALVTRPELRSVITAYFISHSSSLWAPREANIQFVQRWLSAIEAAGVKDVEAAEQLALAAYQTGQMELTERWLKRARGDSPVAQWLQAKLYMRAGKVDQAAALLTRVAHSFPLDPPAVADPARATFAQRLQGFDGGAGQTLSPGQEVLGELGVLKLARREYREALDSLLRSGYWADAAYVAERVLTLDELKRYVSLNWSEVELTKTEFDEDGKALHGPVKLSALDQVSNDIRYLLARRLTRNNRGSEAREFYPPDARPQFDELIKCLTAGWDESLSASQRATALYEAAKITRRQGMELLGTEGAPDWFVHGGRYEYGPTLASRTAETLVIKPTADELQRAADNDTDALPDRRFHYRYVAALLAWNAAKLMPNNSDETARVLCTAGSWLKDRDPQTADLFYKSLVRRCRQTALGQEADHKRWFPNLE